LPVILVRLERSKVALVIGAPMILISVATLFVLK